MAVARRVVSACNAVSFGRAAALVIGSSVLTGCAPDRPDRVRSVNAPFADARCADRIGATLEEWSAGTEYLDGAPDLTGAATIRFPTARLGVWVIVVIGSYGEARVDRVASDQLVSRRFASDCTNQDRVTETTPSPAAVSFGDDDLRAAVERAERGVVVYAWSPHMPLSVDGWPEIADAAGGLGLDPIPVHFARGDTAFARREAQRVGMPAIGLQEVHSVELILRDLQVHAPSILVFADDRVSPVLPGYRNAEGYARFLRAFLDSPLP